MELRGKIMPVTYEPIATTTLGSATGTITFSSIPSTYTDLRIVLVAVSSTSSTTEFRFNGNSATNYSYTRLLGTGTAAASGGNSTATTTYINPYGISSTQPSMATVDILSYAGSTYKTALSTSSNDINGSGGYVIRGAHLWRQTSAITSISLLADTGSGTFNVGTTATLYGIKAA
jgi:hypothetical protein